MGNHIIYQTHTWHLGKALYIILGVMMFLPMEMFAVSSSIQNTFRGIEFQNDHVRLVLSDKAEVLHCIEKRSAMDIAPHNHRKIASAVLKDGTKLSATKLVYEGGILSVFFGEESVDLKVNAFSDFFTIEVNDIHSSRIDILNYITLKFSYDYSERNVFLAAGVTMSLRTNPVFYPTGESGEVIGRCMSTTGIKGAKLGVVFCRKDELRGILKQIYSILPNHEIPISTAGGPFALDNISNSFDCLITNDADPAYIQQQIDAFSKYGIRQFDFLKGTNTFIQGEFSFPAFGSADAFRKQITEPLLKAGIISSLHTYSYYISYEANELLSSPRWQQQLEFRESFVLSADLSSTSQSINVRGDISSIYDHESFWTTHSPYLLIENEIVKYTLDDHGFATLKRGQCGTLPVNHKKGSIVRIIGGQFSHIAPQIGSELFYEIARRTAVAYNEGGFKGFYFDALDGLAIHLKNANMEDRLWYYSASFINEVLRYCNGNPIVEYSTLNPSIWSARGRGGAKDIPFRGYKRFITEHIEANKILMDRQYVTTLGWFNFYPVRKGEESNYATKYLFFDDVDYIGANALAYNQTMVYNNLKIKDIETTPALQRNLDRFALYNQLRTADYFSGAVKHVLQEGKYEYRLNKKGLRWGFNEAHYCKAKIHSISDGQLIGHNPFKKQKPFIRLEVFHSSDCSSQTSLMTFDESKDFINQVTTRTFPTPVNISNKLGIRVSLKGNGRESRDAICIRLLSSDTSGYADFVVRSDFDGWKDVILTNLDNGDYSDLVFDGMDNDLYKVHRKTVDFNKVSVIQVFNSGNCKGVKIKRIDAVPLTPHSLLNPSIHLGQANVTFSDTISSGEYVEYNVGEKMAKVYDCLGNSRNSNVVINGQFRIPKGDFCSFVSCESDLRYIPGEVALTFGLYGKFIHN